MNYDKKLEEILRHIAEFCIEERMSSDDMIEYLALFNSRDWDQRKKQLKLLVEKQKYRCSMTGCDHIAIYTNTKDPQYHAKYYCGNCAVTLTLQEPWFKLKDLYKIKYP